MQTIESGGLALTADGSRIRWSTPAGTGPWLTLPPIPLEGGSICGWSVGRREPGVLRFVATVPGANATVRAEAEAGCPVIRVSLSVRADSAGVSLAGAPFVPIALPLSVPRSLLWIPQHNATYREESRFTRNQSPVVDGRTPLELCTGSYPSSHGAPTACGWIAVRSGDRDFDDGPVHRGPGFVVGVEYNGKARIEAWGERGAVHVAGQAVPFGYPLPVGEEIELPSLFVGLFDGDWDDAADLTHRYAESSILMPAPDNDYPWVQYDSWGYGQQIDEANQRRALEVCRSVGVEAFVLDLGWARRIGEWTPDPQKFPRGLAPLAREATADSIRFGVHVAHTQADPASPVVRDHPDWVIAEADDYFGAVGLCIGHEPCRDWIIAELSRLAGEEGITYLLQDGEDIVKHCTAAGHTHGPRGSHFAASSRGLDVMLDTLHRRHPDLVLENCEDGGVMLTYAMARRYHTTITVDNIGTYHTRQGVYGASYPFPPRYSVRYMQDAPDPYSLRSVLFGGPLILMQRAGQWSPEQIERVRGAIAEYKAWRSFIASSRVIHLRDPIYRPDGPGWDAIAAVARDGSRALVLAYRHFGGADEVVLRLRGLLADVEYEVVDHDAVGGGRPRTSGGRLAEDGLRVSRPPFSSALIELRSAH